MTAVDLWAERLGYDRLGASLLRATDSFSSEHPFSSEIRSVLQPPDGEIGVSSVFCIDQVPTIYLVDAAVLPEERALRRAAVHALCERLWNQNLARALIVAELSTVEIWSIDNPSLPSEVISVDDVPSLHDWSAKGLVSGEVLKGRDGWFDPRRRVDKTLLENVSVLVDGLVAANITPAKARELTANVIFVAYLEDRGIVSPDYHRRRRVEPLFNLLSKGDAVGIETLFEKLHSDFNGDFTRPSSSSSLSWKSLPKKALSLLHQFLSQTVLRSGQKDFWRYDFGHIPIELIAGIYETFLASKGADDDVVHTAASHERLAGTKRSLGAYYTPRILADWVVDLAFENRSVLEERVFDGACGSGMLLTAAFRRMIRAQKALAEKRGDPSLADFRSRCILLKERIFGADIDRDACRLTAFSLYLALLEDLTPRDIAVLRSGGQKLPNLERNIRGGKDGDFFNIQSEKAARGQYTIFISNPPWREVASADVSGKAITEWIGRQPAPKPHIAGRQMATAFALGAADCLKPDGRAVLILPVNPFVSSERTRRMFRADVLGRFKLDRIVNFSDMRRLIFADAVHPFVVMRATAKQTEQRYASIRDESFEYWTPKADVALAFGRFTMHGADKAVLPASAFIDETPYLQLRYWGGERDLTLLQRLWRHGKLKSLFESSAEWEVAKGFHLKDEDRRRPKNTWYVNAPDWMKKRRFLRSTRLSVDLPLVDPNVLEGFPFETIAREAPKRFFQGPRVLWPDGTHPENGVKAIYSDIPFTFQHSLGVISAPDTEEGRLIAKFLVAYMRSPMAIWLSLLLSKSVASERPKLHVAELMDWPFWHPSSHPDPARAKRVLKEIGSLTTRLEGVDELLRAQKYESLKERFDRLVFDYFGLSDTERVLVQELAEYVGPSLQPSSLKYEALMKPLRAAPSSSQLSTYCAQMEELFEKWREVTGGEGAVAAFAWSARSIPVGAAVFEFRERGSKPQTADNTRLDDDDVIPALFGTLEHVLSKREGNLLAMPNITLAEKNRITIIKPMVMRFWLGRAAMEDAARIARDIQSLQRTSAQA